MKDSDHETLHDWIARAALAGSGAAVLSLLLQGVPGRSPGQLAAAFFLALVVGAVVPPASVLDGIGLSLLSLAAAAAAPLPGRLALPAIALAIGLGLARRADSTQRGLRRRLEIVGFGSVAALTALVIRRALDETGALSSIFGPGLGALGAGAIAGAITGLGAIGRLLGPEKVEVGVDLGTLATEVTAANPEVGALLSRAAEAHRQAAEVVGGIAGPEAQAAKAAADDLVLRLMRFGREWMEIERRATSTTPESLTERVVLLETRLDKSSDPIARAELGRAVKAVKAQAEALVEILRGRERAVARLEHQVAILERLRLAALRHRSADAGRLQAELQPVLEELSEAGGDYDLASDALRDVDGETAEIVVPATPTEQAN